MNGVLWYVEVDSFSERESSHYHLPSSRLYIQLDETQTAPHNRYQT